MNQYFDNSFSNVQSNTQNLSTNYQYNKHSGSIFNEDHSKVKKDLFYIQRTSSFNDITQFSKNCNSILNDNAFTTSELPKFLSLSTDLPNSTSLSSSEISSDILKSDSEQHPEYLLNDQVYILEQETNALLAFQTGNIKNIPVLTFEDIINS